MPAQVGQDIEALCRKCGDVWHVVVALQGSAIAKVQCKQCGGYHRYRPTEAAAAASKRSKAASRASTGGRAGATAAKGKRSKTKAPEEPLVEPDPSRSPVRYRMSDTLAERDTVEHPTFGTGVVERVLEDRKVQVFFPGGRRVLAHQRSG